MMRDIRNPFELEKDYYNTVRLANFYSNNDIQYESNSDRSDIGTYLKDITNNLKKSDTWKI